MEKLPLYPIEEKDKGILQRETIQKVEKNIRTI